MPAVSRQPRNETAACELTQQDRDIHEWQLDVKGFGESGQRQLKNATVLISRVGGLGSPVAWDLAAAGIGRLMLVHGGTPSPSDFNRQTLMEFERQNQNRAEQAAEKIRAFKPGVDVVAIPKNISTANADELISQADLVVDCAPMFEERLAMNDAAWKFGRPIVEAAMYELQGTVSLLVPGQTACLRCLVPHPPTHWKRRFPVFGAVSSAVGSMAAMEAIKHIAGFGQTLCGRRLQMDLRSMQFHITHVTADPNCTTCGSTTTARS
jgi:molybdopterin/thiamine biosynthesis adenylyltransferase